MNALFLEGPSCEDGSSSMRSPVAPVSADTGFIVTCADLAHRPATSSTRPSGFKPVKAGQQVSNCGRLKRWPRLVTSKPALLMERVDRGGEVARTTSSLDRNSG